MASIKSIYFTATFTKIDNEYAFEFSRADRERFQNFLLSISAGTVLKYEVSYYDEAKENNRKRTEQQNRYYHKLLDIIADYTGDEHMTLHENLKCRFLSRPWIMEAKEYTIVKSTRDLTPKEFGDYLEKVFEWASLELGLVLPAASEYYQ